MDIETKTESNVRFEATYLERTEGGAGVRKTIERHGGKILAERPCEKVRLAYPMEKQTYAFLSVTEFTLSTAALRELQEELRLNGELLRVLIHRAPRVAADRGREAQHDTAGVSAEASATSAQAGGRPPRTLRPLNESVLTNEALEKKIEEILQ